ncbi:MAG: LysR family transcriptional regulator [Gammaproteobacteria bacterium]|nr:LysR family transcriptional regulator [Gammaproteobacteria bacterium]
MDRLSRVPIFVAVAKHGSFAEAARRLGMTGSAVSKQVQRLEADLGVRLFHRTTRQLSLTDEGSYLFEHSAPLVEGLEEVGELLAGRKAKPEGLLRISAPVGLAQRVLKTPLATFASRYPEIGVHLELSDRFVDLVAEGFDLALRIGHLEDSSLVARRIADVPLVVVASPALLATHGHPETPQALAQFPFVHYVTDSGRSRLTLQQEQNEPETVVCQGRMSSNNDQMMVAFALAGLGVITLPRFMVEDELARGELQVLLPEYRIVPTRRLYAVFPNGRHLPLKTRILIDFLVDSIIL